MRIITVLSALMLLIAGCSKLTPENYAKIKVGMTYDEVTTVLGRPAACDDTLGLKTCQWGDKKPWGDDKRHVTVRFAAEKVLLYSAENIQ